jgi:cytochrome b pre-mRNA-processing protein 3
MTATFLRRWLGGSPEADASHRLHARMVAQSRHPDFYASLWVPDTLDGRFDLLVLHLFLVLHRLKADDRAAARLGRAVFETTVAGFDRDFREEGIGDSGVSRRVDAMLRAVAGRLGTYGAAFAAPDPRVLEAALDNNVFGTAAVPETAVQAMARYARAAARELAGQPLSKFHTGDIAFPPPRPDAGASGKID